MKTTLTWTLASDFYLPERARGDARPERALSFTGRYRSREAAERAGKRIFGASGADYRVVADLVKKRRDRERRDREAED